MHMFEEGTGEDICPTCYVGNGGMAAYVFIHGVSSNLTYSCRRGMSTVCFCSQSDTQKKNEKEMERDSKKSKQKMLHRNHKH